MNLQKNKALIVGAGICGILLLTEIIFLVSINGGLLKHRQELQRSYHRLSLLHDRNPFPSVENIKAMRTNLEDLEYDLDELVAGIMRDAFPQDAVEATDFSARAQDVIERFRKRADQSGVTLPKSLEVGFSKYASGGAVPELGNVPRLSRQLYSVERVADVLVRSGVDSIDGLTRDSFEESPSVERSAPRRRSSRQANQDSNAQNSLHLIASTVHPENLYYIERIGVSFSAKEEAVWRVLDQFASASHFMVVSGFSHSTKSTILKFNPSAVKRGEVGDDDTLRYLAEGILVGSKALSRPERIISGNEMIQVYLDVEVYNFEPEIAEK